jgi:Putative Flp pilus-assembly TadE/G-like
MIVMVFARTDEKGAVTVIVALFITVLFAFVALSVDVARLYEERRALVSAADLSALAGSQLLWKGETDAEAEAQLYVTLNPSINHPGAYSASGGDLVEAKRQADGSGCGANVDSTTGALTLDPTLSLAGSQTYDCVVSKVTAPAFKFLFGSVLGLNARSVSATSTSFMGNGAPKGTTIIPWLLKDCPNSSEFPDEATVSVSGCPYRFSDSFINDPASPYVTAFEEGANFSGAVMPYDALSGGCPKENGYKSGMSNSNSVYSNMNQGSSSFTPCRIAPGMRVDTRGGNLGAQLASDLSARGVTTGTCANSTAFNNALGRTGDGDGFVTIKQRNACLINVAFVVFAAPASRVPSAYTDTAGTPAGMQANLSEASGNNRFADLTNNKTVVIRRLAWYYITGFTSGGQPKPIGVYLRAIDNDNSVLTGPMDTCPAATPIAECAQHGIYIVKLAG